MIPRGKDSTNFQVIKTYSKRYLRGKKRKRYTQKETQVSDKKKRGEKHALSFETVPRIKSSRPTTVFEPGSGTGTISCRENTQKELVSKTIIIKSRVSERVIGTKEKKRKETIHHKHWQIFLPFVQQQLFYDSKQRTGLAQSVEHCSVLP